MQETCIPSAFSLCLSSSVQSAAVDAILIEYRLGRRVETEDGGSFSPNGRNGLDGLRNQTKLRLSFLP